MSQNKHACADHTREHRRVHTHGAGPTRICEHVRHTGRWDGPHRPHCPQREVEGPGESAGLAPRW